MADIDLSGQYWIPIGSKNTAIISDFFEGNFNGNNFKISNLTIDTRINVPYSDFIGLFSYSKNASVINITLEDVNIIYGYRNVGALVGACIDTIFDNCLINGDVYGYDACVSLLCGFTRGCNINNVEVRGNITATYGSLGGIIGTADSYNSGGEMYEDTILNDVHADIIITTEYGDGIGGLVGWNDEGNLIISRCSATGVLNGGNDEIGGLVGYSRRYADLRLTQSYANVEVNGSGYSTGGLVGEAWIKSTNPNSYIKNCYARGIVNGGVYGTGGLIGMTDFPIENCYSTGLVQGSSDIGGLIGDYYGSSIINCYYDSETSGQSDTGKGIPKTTLEMTYPYSDLDNIYIDWVFYDDENYVWVHDKDTYEYDITRIITDSDFIIDTCTVYGADRAFCEYRYLASIFYQSVSYDGVTMIFGENDVTSYIKVVGGVTYLPVRVIAQDLYNLRVIWSELNYQVLLFGCVDGTINDGYPHFIKPSKLIHRILIPITGGTIVYL